MAIVNALDIADMVLADERVCEVSYRGPVECQEATTVPAFQGLRDAAILSSGGVQPGPMDVGDEDHAQSVSQALERDMSSNKKCGSAFHSTREDECFEACSDDLPFAELESGPPLLRLSVVAMRVGLPQVDLVDPSQVLAG